MRRSIVLVAAALLSGCVGAQGTGAGKKGIAELLLRSVVQSKAVDDHVEACLADRPGDLANCDRWVARSRYRAAQAKRDRERSKQARAAATQEHERFVSTVLARDVTAAEIPEQPSTDEYRSVIIDNPNSESLAARLSEELAQVIGD